MKPAARIHACIEIIDAILTENSVPADNLLTTYFRKRRYIGSHDRKFIAENVYQILRHKILLTALWQRITASSRINGRTLMLSGLIHLQQKTLEDVSSLFSGEAYGPALLKEKEKEALYSLKKGGAEDLNLSEQLNLQAWQYTELKNQYGDDLIPLLKSLDQQAAFDLRINTLVTTSSTVLTKLQQEGIVAEKGKYAPTALRLPDRRPLGKHPLWVDGSLEVQDEGSQIIAYLVDAKPGQWVWDYCAGAGGKSLALAALMLNQGRLIVSDTVEWRLQRSRERFKRAKVHNIECHLLGEDSSKWIKRQQEKFDRVLVDVPCSGSGTWRRNPDLKWRAKEEEFHQLQQIQAQILRKAARFVKPGGRLIYSTCSLYSAENENQVNAFLQENPCFSLVPIPTVWSQVLQTPCPTTKDMLQLRPDLHQMDGFFVAVMQKNAMNEG